MSLSELLIWARARGRWLLLGVLLAAAIGLWPSGSPPRLPSLFRSESVMCFPSDWNGCDQVLLQHMLASPEFLERVSATSDLSPDEVRSGMGYQPDVDWQGRVRRIRFWAIGDSPQKARRLAESLVGEQIGWLQEEMSRAYDQEIARLEKQLSELEARRKQAYHELLKLPQVSPAGRELALLRGYLRSLDFWETELRRVQLELLEELPTEQDVHLSEALQKLERLRLVFFDQARAVQTQASLVERLRRLSQAQQQQRQQARQRRLGQRRQRCLAEIQGLNEKLERLKQRRLDESEELRRSRLEQEWKALDQLLYQVQFQLFQARQERHRARREGGFLILQSASAGLPLERTAPPMRWSRTRSVLLLGVALGVVLLKISDQLRRRGSLEERIVEQLSLPLLGIIPRQEQG